VLDAACRDHAFSELSTTAQQKAIAAARAWAQAEAAGRIQKSGARTDLPTPKEGVGLIASPRDHFGAMFGVGKGYVEMARA